MGLKLNFDENQKLTITGEHTVFIGTPFHGCDFEIQVKPPTRKELAALEKKHTSTGKGGRADFDAAAYNEDVFKTLVIGWQKIDNDQGNELPCNDTTKGLIFENYTQLAQCVIQAATMVRNEVAVQREDEAKN